MLIDGKKLADDILAEVREEVLKTEKKIRLVIVKVGDDPVSQKFINQKKIFGEKAGIEVEERAFPESIKTAELRKRLAGLVHKKQTHGVIIQLPLPEHINAQYILNSIPSEKDIDMLSIKSLGDFLAGKSGAYPPIVGAIREIFKEYKIDIKNKNIAVFGAGRLVGKPVASWLLNENAGFCVITANTPDPKFYTLAADIIISGVGKPKLITSDMVKEGAVVIDCGTSLETSKQETRLRQDFGGQASEQVRSEQGTRNKLAGDVDFGAVSKKASLITPVPGGVGPLTVAMIFRNLIDLQKKKG